MEPTRRRAAVYIRVSQVGRRDRTSASYITEDAQEDGAKARAVEQGMNVVAVIRDIDRSGRTADRDGLDQILAMAGRGELDAVVVYYLSRLARNLRSSLNVLHELEGSGIEVLSVSERFDRKTTEGRFISHIFASQAEMESDRLKDQWANARHRADARGVWLGRIPWGYAKDPVSRVLVPHPVRAPVIVELYERRAAGAPLSALTPLLDAVDPLPSGTPRGRARAAELIAAPRHRGASPNLPRLVTDAQWYAAQSPALIVPSREGRHDYILTGIARCGSCGGSMAGGGTPARPVYKCSTRQSRGTVVCLAGPSIMADRLEPWVLGLVGAAVRGNVQVSTGGDSETAAALAAVLEESERELGAYVADTTARSIIGEAAWHAGLRVRADAVDEARERAADAANALRAVSAPRTWADVLASPVLLRAALRDRIETLVVHQGRGLPVEERCDIVIRR